MDVVHVNGHDRTNIVILAKRYIRFPDVGSFVIRNMSQHCQIFYNFNYTYELYILCICWIIKCLKLHTLLTSVLDGVNDQLYAPTTLLHDSTLGSERKGSSWIHSRPRFFGEDRNIFHLPESHPDSVVVQPAC